MQVDSSVIQERIRKASNREEKDRAYYLRMVVANLIDGSETSPVRGGESDPYPDRTISGWEEGRSNFIANNTHVAIEGFTANPPDFLWTNIPNSSGRSDLVAAIRKSYYRFLYKDSNLEEQYRLKTFDMLTMGEGNIGTFVKDDGIEVEYCDYLKVDWDPAFKDPNRRRYVIYQRDLPLSIAAKHYPAIERLIPIDSKNYDRIVPIKCYWDRDSGQEAVMFNNQFIDGPKPSRSGNLLPIRATRLSTLPGVIHSVGIVERQLGTQELRLRLRRHYREQAFRATSKEYVSGNIMDENAFKRLEDGDEGVILRLSQGAQIGVTKGAEIQQTALLLDQILAQDMNAESAVNEFKRGQTDTNVEFASALGFMAQQSGARDRYLALRIESGMVDDLQKVIMPVAQSFENREIPLAIDGHTIVFNKEVPLNQILGPDGDVSLKPGGMNTRSQSQKLQETMIFANVISLANGLPPGLQERFIRMALESAEMEDPEGWIADMQAGMEQMQQMQEQAMAEQQQAESAKNAQTPVNA